MDGLVVVGFVASVLIATYIQSVTGFAMGMIIIAVIGGSRLMDIPTLTATVSLLSLVNVVLALRGNVHHVHRPLFGWLALGQIPAIFVGVWLLTSLDNNARWVVELLLGLFVALGSLSMLLRPEPIANLSPRYARFVAGLAGGVVGGMFSASGPVMGWFNYRQPLPLDAIRATLFACFVLTTSLRTVIVGVSGGLTSEVWIYVAIGLPLVVGATWVGRNYPPALPEAIMKRLAFGLMFAMGLWTLGSVLVPMLY